MCTAAPTPIILPMTRPITASKVVLIADRRATGIRPQTGPVRRYQLARLRLDARQAGAESRFDYLKRLYD